MGNSTSPGPGNYEIHLKNLKEAPKFGFGSSTREPLKNKNDSPGPGAYKINSKVGETANYSMPNKSDEFKYIWCF